MLLHSPFKLLDGPLCRFGVDKEKNILVGCIHHLIADGRSIEILLQAIASGQVKEWSMTRSIRKYASFECSSDTRDAYANSLDHWRRMLGDTPKRLEVDLASSSSMSWRREVPLDGETVLALQVFCRKEGVSFFVVAMNMLHQLMRAYSHQAYAIGIARDTRPRQFRDTVGMFVNTVLVPFSGGKAGGSETVQELHA